MDFKFWHAIIVAIECPEPSPNSFGTCDELCTSNNDCSGGQLCCSNGCGHRCMSPVEDPCANIGCAVPNCSEGTVIITQEGQCCPVCGTPPSSSNETVPTSTTPPSQTCPSVQSSNEENCANECSSDDDCQYNRICCSNGCGGHTCSDSVEMCAVAFCGWPRCEDGALPVISPFRCCPFCPTTPPTNSTSTTNQSTTPSVDPTDPTPPTNSTFTTNQSTTPSVGATDPTCPVGGQIRVGCASACNTTCANMNMLLACAATCVINGCLCPHGMVIDEQSNICVSPTMCPSTACPVGGQIRVGCASACNTTCANMNMLLACPEMCVVNGCQCPHGMVIDEQSNTCVSPTVCPSTGETCPTVQKTNEEDCVDECSSNDDCQYNRICCSNGCGGHTCSDSTKLCEVVRCAWPTCEGGVEPETSPFRCCPFCPSQADGNSGGVIAIACLMIIIMCCLITFS